MGIYFHHKTKIPCCFLRNTTVRAVHFPVRSICVRSVLYIYTYKCTRYRLNVTILRKYKLTNLTFVNEFTTSNQPIAKSLRSAK